MPTPHFAGGPGSPALVAAFLVVLAALVIAAAVGFARAGRRREPITTTAERETERRPLAA
jgi:hypothetical protein